MFTRLWGKYLRKHIAWIAVALVLMVIEGSTLGVLSYMLQPMFDTVFVEGRGDAIMWVGLGIFGLFIVRAVTSVAQRSIITLSLIHLLRCRRSTPLWTRRTP